MNELVRLTTQDVGKGIPITDSKVVSESFELQHHTITRLIRKYEDDFKEFGEVGFEIQALESGQNEKVYLINEMQFTLLVTYLRNSPKITEYKKKFVKAFFFMKNELQARIETRHIGIYTRKSLTDAIKENVTDEGKFKSFAYSNYSKLVYKKVLGRTVKKAKEELRLKEKDNIRNYLTMEQLQEVQKIESKIAMYIETLKDMNLSDKETYNKIKEMLDK